MVNAPKVPFGQLYSIPSKNGLTAPSRVRGSGVSLVNMRELFAYSRIASPEMELVPLPLANADSWLLEGGDLLFARQSLVASGAGKCVLVQDSDVPRTFESHIIRVRLRSDLCNPAFYFYFFNSAIGRNTMASIVEQVAAAGIRSSDLAKLEVPLPSLQTQDVIVDTLGALDDKIESNRRAQGLIEGLVRGIVERALDESEGEMGTLASYCSLVKSSAKVHELVSDENYISFEHMPKGSIALETWETQDGLASAKSRFAEGDILFGKLRPYFKKIGIAPIGGVCSNDILVLRPNTKAATAVVSMVASSDALIEQVSSAATGTRMPRASWKDVSSWPMPELRPDELATLGEVTSPLLERMVSMTHENRRLSELRDALLPELLSDPLDISKAAHVVRN